MDKRRLIFILIMPLIGMMPDFLVYADQARAGLLEKHGSSKDYLQLEWSGQYCGEKSPSAIIADNGFKWARLWRKASGMGFAYDDGRDIETKAPEIDFEKYVVAAVFLGTRPTGGYWIEFGKPYLKDNEMIIPYSEHKPAGFVTQALTQPYRMKVFEKKGAGTFSLLPLSNMTEGQRN